MNNITKVHTIYKKKDGTIVPGSTTILSILDKPALIHWAWNLGCIGQDYRKVRDQAANIGTIAHYIIECYLIKQEPDLSDYTPNNIKKANNAFQAYLEFEKRYNLKIIKSELPLVSEKYNYGGTIDCYCMLNDHFALLDFKTSSGLYPEMRCQVASYQQLLIEHRYQVDEVHLLRIDKETGEFNHYELKNLEKEWKLFKLLAKAYPLKKDIWSKISY